MNIAAVMDALDVWELDRLAKHALVMMCCHADRDGHATVSTGRIAADMKVQYAAAQRALARVVEAGYLAVDKRPGKSPIWVVSVLYLARWREAPRALGTRTPRAPRARRKDSLGEIQGAPSLSSGKADNNGVVEKAAVPHPADPAAIAGCPYCDEHGWLWVGELVEGRCTHRVTRAVTDLTVAQILDVERA